MKTIAKQTARQGNRLRLAEPIEIDGILPRPPKEADFARFRSSIFAEDPASLRVRKTLGFSVTRCDYVQGVAPGQEDEHIRAVFTLARFAELVP